MDFASLDLPEPVMQGIREGFQAGRGVGVLRHFVAGW